MVRDLAVIEGSVSKLHPIFSSVVVAQSGGRKMSRPELYAGSKIIEACKKVFTDLSSPF